MRFFFTLMVTLLAATPLLTTPPVELEGRSGSIHSDVRIVRFPDGPAQETYPNNVNMSWKITVRSGYRVALYFSVFELEDSYDENVGGACVYDYLEIEGYGRICGNDQNFPNDAPRPGKVFRSDGNIMIVRFVTDYSNAVGNKLPFGFVGHYYEEDVDECSNLEHSIQSGVEDWDEILYCDHHCHNVPGSYYCTCRPGYTLDDNQHTCVANCLEEQYAMNEGIIKSADYPNPYGKLSDCETTLHAGRGKRLDVCFEEEFGIEDHYEEGCVYDWLKLTDDRGVERIYCGISLPENGSWLGLNTSWLQIYFHSDLTVEKSGYKIRYRTHRVKCHGTLDPPTNGSIVSRSWNGIAEYEDEIRFACNLGYRLVGSSVSTCDENGNWSSPTPTCEIKHCPRPDALLRVNRTEPPMFEESERVFNSTISIPCVQWYELVSGATEWYCGDDGNWHWKGPVVVPNNNRNFPECRPYCGIKNAVPHLDFFAQQILGGRNTRFGEWPWMALISKDRGLRGNNICGGSLVAEQYVVTAAHCFRFDRTGLRVYLGVTDRFNRTSEVQEFAVKSFVNHQGHGASSKPTNSFDDDIAVIKLDRPAVIGRNVRPICIPRSPIEVELPLRSNKTGVVIGWGAMDAVDKTPARILQQVRVPYVNQNTCNATFNRQSRNYQFFNMVRITHNQFCAGYLNSSRDSCNGDSGGPLMWRNQRRWFLNGIVSFGTKFGSCGRDVLGVHTNVSNYHDFLDSNIITVP